MDVITQKQEAFVQDVFKDINPGRAYLNHYHCKSLGVAGACATRLLKKAKIKDRLDQLRQKVEDASVATVLERKQILTEIARGRLSDFMGEALDSDKLRSAALQEIKIIEGKDKSTTVKLHNPIQAIAEMNKMEGAYAPDKHINLNLEASDLTDEQLEGIAGGKRITSGSGNGTAEPAEGA